MLNPRLLGCENTSGNTHISWVNFIERVNLAYKCGLINHSIPSIKHFNPSIKHFIPSINHYTPSINHSTPSINYSTPSINHSTPSINHSTPSIEHSTPFSNHFHASIILLHPSIISLHPSNILVHPVIIPLHPSNIPFHSSIILLHPSNIPVHQGSSTGVECSVGARVMISSLHTSMKICESVRAMHIQQPLLDLQCEHRHTLSSLPRSSKPLFCLLQSGITAN
ncbi:hypothetical protein FHG87_018272 [Trinorchestia longiramus]|nr:hypothetical protein FHG87_018272 [Trinorchestia longiramus]